MFDELSPKSADTDMDAVAALAGETAAGGPSLAVPKYLSYESESWVLLHL